MHIKINVNCSSGDIVTYITFNMWRHWYCVCVVGAT